jgi:3-hydroxyacyl-CoA dehydrogenase
MGRIAVRDRVTIAGCGLIGRGWAAAFARAGWHVAMWDAIPEALAPGKAAVEVMFADMQAAGMVPQETAALQITTHVALENALAGARYVQESAPEVKAVKAALFRKLDELAPDGALIGSSTSTIPGSAFLAYLPGRSRCMVAHPANPPHLMPVVELVPAPWNTEVEVAQFLEVMSGIGQVPVVLRREIDGFVMNRLQTAVVNEAIALVAQGVIDAAGLDVVMKQSLGLRWALLGPFETMHLNAPGGFADYAARYGRHYQQMGQSLSVADAWPPEALLAIDAACRNGMQAPGMEAAMLRRDRLLMRLLATRSLIEGAGQDWDIMEESQT